MKDELAGTTAVCVILKDKKIYCGNVGDSRVIASVRGRVQNLSYDHKPNNELETKRILAAGGWVEFNRVNGYYHSNYDCLPCDKTCLTCQN